MAPGVLGLLSETDELLGLHSSGMIALLAGAVAFAPPGMAGGVTRRSPPLMQQQQSATTSPTADTLLSRTISIKIDVEGSARMLEAAAGTKPSAAAAAFLETNGLSHELLEHLQHAIEVRARRADEAAARLAREETDMATANEEA